MTVFYLRQNPLARLHRKRMLATSSRFLSFFARTANATGSTRKPSPFAPFPSRRFLSFAARKANSAKSAPKPSRFAPFLARPVIHLARPETVVALEELGCAAYAENLWSAQIQGFPVLEHDNLESELLACRLPQVAVMGMSNAGKSTLINALLGQNIANWKDADTIKQELSKGHVRVGELHLPRNRPIQKFANRAELEEHIDLFDEDSQVNLGRYVPYQY